MLLFSLIFTDQLYTVATKSVFFRLVSLVFCITSLQYVCFRNSFYGIHVVSGYLCLENRVMLFPCNFIPWSFILIAHFRLKNVYERSLQFRNFYKLGRYLYTFLLGWFLRAVVIISVLRKFHSYLKFHLNVILNMCPSMETICRACYGRVPRFFLTLYPWARRVGRVQRREGSKELILIRFFIWVTPSGVAARGGRGGRVFFHPRFFSSPDECFYSNCTAGGGEHATNVRRPRRVRPQFLTFSHPR